MKPGAQTMSPKSLLARTTVVLVRPRVPENIGAAARVAFNMGIGRLSVVRDHLPPREPMARMATHKAAHLIDELQLFTTLAEALRDISVVVGTSARRGRQRYVQQTPREVVEQLLPLLPNNTLALVFGPEDAGLTNDELQLCHMATAIPTADFSSLNLAQAVAIYCYELYHGVVHAQKDMVVAPELATSHELESMYGFLQQSLFHINFLEECGRKHWMGNIRNLLGRIRLTSKDANIIRGICKKFLQQQRSTVK